MRNVKTTICGQLALALALTWPLGIAVGAIDVAVWCCVGIVVCAGADMAVWCGIGIVVGVVVCGCVA